MTLSERELERYKSYSILYGSESLKVGGTSIVILGRRATPFDVEDGNDAAEATDRLRDSLCARSAKSDPVVIARRRLILAKFKEAFALAGLSTIYMEEIENGYCYSAAHKFESPWYVVTTPVGHFRVGWRKSVIELDWERTTIAKDGCVIFADEDTTQDRRLVHAWGYEKLVDYLRRLVS